MSLRVIRTVCIAVFVGGIAGMIVSSINGNNVGLVTTIGLVTAMSEVRALVRDSIDLGRSAT
jgi:hypothetical protein